MIQNSITAENYKERIVVFLDILGMKEFAKQSENQAKLLEFFSCIRNLLKCFESKRIETEVGGYKYFEDQTKNTDLDYKFISLSDAVIISFNPESLIFLGSLIRKIRIIYFLSLVILGMPCRGGISIGKFFHDKDSNITFGEGLVKAANLEKKEILPKVVVDKKIVERIDKIIEDPTTIIEFFKKMGVISDESYAEEVCIKSLNDCLKIDDDNDKLIIDIFESCNDTLGRINEKLRINITRECLIKKADEEIQNTEDELIRQKWDYIKKQL